MKFSITITDINFSYHCELFEEEGGFAKLDQFVNTDIERHNELASAIRQNVNQWKDQRKLNIEGKDKSRFNKSLNRENIHDYLGTIKSLCLILPFHIIFIFL